MNMGGMTSKGLKIRKLVTEFILTSPQKRFYLKEIYDEHKNADAKIIANSVRYFVKTKLVKRIGRAYYEIINFTPVPDGKPKTEILASELADQFIDGWNNMKSIITGYDAKTKEYEKEISELRQANRQMSNKLDEMDNAIIKLKRKQSKTISL